VYVLGENTIRGTYIRNSRIICEIAELCGLRLKERRVRNLPANRRYLPPPQSKFHECPHAAGGGIGIR